MSEGFQVVGTVAEAPFTLKIHRGEGMCLLAMNWKGGPPPNDFVGFAIEFKRPQDTKFLAVSNFLGFLGPNGEVDHERHRSVDAPIQKFRWVHFPLDPEGDGETAYRVTPMFMDAADKLTAGVAQEASVRLSRETFPGMLNVGYTRGFVSSQAFVSRFGSPDGKVGGLIPGTADEGIDFKPTHPKADEAYGWMGFEARQLVLGMLDAAIEDPSAKVGVVAYDLNQPEVVERLEKLGPRLKAIIDDSEPHAKPESGESVAAERLAKTAGAGNVKRQHMGGLQHNKFFVIDGDKVKLAICGSTNFSWRGFYVQNNNAVVVSGAKAIQPFKDAFEGYWESGNSPSAFGKLPVAEWQDLGLEGVDAKITFSPHSSGNAMLETIADDIENNTTSSLLYSLAFLYQTPGKTQDAIRAKTLDDDIFVYGMSDKLVKNVGDPEGLDVAPPDGNVRPVFPKELSKNVPPPFSEEPSGGGGVRMHHKFVVIDFDKPTARVYFGSYNFSVAADGKNGENLVVIRDRRVATSYMVQALSIFDHYHFRVAAAEAKEKGKPMALRRPPRAPGEKPWFAPDYAVPYRIRDREVFA